MLIRTFFLQICVLGISAVLCSKTRNNLKTIINGFEKVIKMMEKYPKQLFNECFDIANPEEGHKQLFRFYINIVQFKLFAEALLREKQTISTLIPNMRFFQHHLFSFWKTTTNFDVRTVQNLIDDAIITKYAGYDGPVNEFNNAVLFSFVLKECIANYEKLPADSGDVRIYEFIQHDIAVLLQRVVMGNTMLYKIESMMPPTLKSPRITFSDHVVETTVANEVNVARSFVIPGDEYILEQIRNINSSAGLVTFYLDDNITFLMQVDVKTAFHLIKTILCDDLRNFQLTGNPLTIVSRFVLKVMYDRKDSESYATRILKDALEKLEIIENNLQEKTRKVSKKKIKINLKSKRIAPSKAKPNFSPTNKNNNQRKQKNLPKKAPKPLSNRQSYREEISDELGDENFDLSPLKSALEDPTLYYLQSGQFCYDAVLDDLLEKLGMTEYTWKQVSEACSTPLGFRALAELGLTLSQVDLCIRVVRDRVPYAHPRDVPATRAQDDLAIIKGQHPELSDVIDQLRQQLAVKTGWYVVPGSSNELLKAVPMEEVDLAPVVMRVSEYCWQFIVGPIAADLGLDPDTSSLGEIIHAAKEIGVNADPIFTCRPLIKLRNQYAHQPVSPEVAKTALRSIFGKENAYMMTVLEPILSRAQEKLSEGIKFY